MRACFAIFAVVCPLLDPTWTAADAPSGAEETKLARGGAMDNEINQRAVVESYLTYFFEHTNSARLTKAKRFVPRVVAAASKEHLDPLLVAIVIACESSWKPEATGKVGEVGLMQVHGVAASGYDTGTLDGNLAAGCAWLASRITKYGLLAGMQAYIGQGDEAEKRGAWRVQLYQREKKRQGLE